MLEERRCYTTLTWPPYFQVVQLLDSWVRTWALSGESEGLTQTVMLARAKSQETQRSAPQLAGWDQLVRTLLLYYEVFHPYCAC
jgi:hypothetical protein